MKPASLIAVLFCLVSTSCLTSAVRANPCVSPPAGLVGWWPGEGNANDIIGTNNATLSANGASYAPGMVGMGFRLDGTNGYVQVPYSVTLEPTNVTVEAWVWLDPNANTNPCTESIVFKQNTWSAWFEGYSLAKTSLQNPDGSYSNHFQFTISRNGDQVGINSVTIVQRGVWYHVAATYDGNQSTLYVNGVAEASTVAGFPLDYGSEPVYFGTTGTWVPYLSMFAGIIDEPSIYSRNLSSNEIAALFAAGIAGKCSTTVCVPPPSGLVGWWKGDGNTVDAAAGNNGTGFNVNYTDGVVGQAFSFDPENLPYGSYTAVAVPDEPAYMLTNSLTIESWVRPRGDGYVIFFRGDHRPGFDPYFLSMQANSNLDFDITQADGSTASVGTTLNYDQWTHIAATLDGGTGTMCLYTNGVLASQLITTIRPYGPLDPTQSPGIGIGNVNDGGNNFPFTGDIDEISLYNRALSSTEVATIYNAGSAGKCANSSPLPVITMEPANQTANVGGTATFSVTANSTTPLFYQWTSNTVSIAGATNATLVLTNVQLNQSGTVYYVTVINSGGATNSTPAMLTVTPPPPCDPTPSGIVGWWPGEGNANDMVAGNNGTLPNGGGYTNGEVGMAFNFNGGNQYLLVQPTNSALDVGQGNGLTVEAWINPGSLSSPEIITEYERVLGSGSGSDVGVDFAINNNNTSNLPGGVAANIVDTNDVSHEIASSGNLITAGMWQHVALTYDKVSGLGTLYVNGLIVAQTNLGSFTPQTSFTNILTARTTFNSVASPNAAFAGGLDELSFYNRALSSNEIAAIYHATFTGKCPPPTPPAIVSQTPSQIVLVGNPVTFSVTATGSQPLNYFWSQNNALIPNATNSSYTLSNPQLSDSGSKFSCLVSNAYGTAVSSNVSLKVLDTVSNDLCSGAVVITSYNYTNTQSTLNASSYGDPVPDCVDGFGNGVWYQFNAPVSGLLYVDTFGSDFDTGLAAYTGSCGSLTEVACNDDTLGVTSQVIVPAVAGTTYYFLAGGYAGHAGNLVFHLNYITPPVFVVQPTNLAVVVSSNAIFSPTLSGAQPMTFQWYFNSAPLVDGGRISGSTNSTLTVADVQTIDAGNYQLVASNFLGSATSSVAVLTPVILPPVFTQPPTDQSVLAGSNVIFTGTVSGTPPFGYQWYFNGLPLTDDGIRIAGSTTSSLNISNLTLADAGNYSLVVTNVSGSVSAGAILTVLAPPAVTLQPIGRSVPPGLPTTFTAVASGVPTPNYQWQLNGTNIPGATSANYPIASVGTNMLGFYQLMASNSFGTAVSAPAQLTFGPVAAWGLNASHECLPPPGLSNVVGLAGSYQSSFALRADGTIAAWGSGTYTNLFTGTTNAVALSVGDDGFEGAVLGADGTVTGGVPTPAGLTNIVAVSVGGTRFGYALRAEGTLAGWGFTSTNNMPAGLNHVTAVACGYNHTVALRNDGSVFTWGIGPATNLPPGLTNIAAIAAGYSHSLALSSNGTVIAWGTGSGTVLPAGLTNIAAISVYYSGQGQSLNLAVRSNGTVVAWGDNPNGETNPPSALTNLTTVAVAAAVYHGLALVNDGSPHILRPPVGLTAYTGRNVTLQGLAVGTAPLTAR